MVAMDERVDKVRELLHLAGETHHAVYRITDGADDDWATWYSDWLINLSELPDVLGKKPIRSDLTYLLVRLDKDSSGQGQDEPWQARYAREIVSYFGG
jgi:hypothetical protein